MDQIKDVPVEELLKNQLDQQRQVTNSAHQHINHLMTELVFWKKLALNTLGVEKEKVNELVGYANVPNSGSGIGSLTTNRGY